jgi:hypothetical protein
VAQGVHVRRDGREYVMDELVPCFSRHDDSSSSLGVTVSSPAGQLAGLLLF